MKISIITVYNSYNYGSFYQAYALYEVLSAYGDVSFLNTKSRSLFREFLRRIRSSIKEKNIKLLLFEIKKFLWLIHSQKKIKKSKKCNDIVFFGSDEIWNLGRKEMREFPIFWGEGIEAERKIAYAPSVNAIEDCNEDGRILSFLENIKRFYSLSVRDEFSRNWLKSRTDKEISMVLDPTMLFTKEKYLRKIKRVTNRKREKYIAVYLYSYSEREKAYMYLIKRFANKYGYKIVSAGEYSEIADEIYLKIGDCPFAVYEEAEYVFTNTFHGTVFAINMRKPFVCFADGKTKGYVTTNS